MRQTLHIFRKDVRFLWPYIVVALVLGALSAWTRMIDPSHLAKGNATANSIRDMTTFIMLLSWWSLIVAAIRKEPPAGNRQFWVTRPYRWMSLVAAKMLLIILFINLPNLLSDLAILYAHDLSPSLVVLLERQAGAMAMSILPAAALAAATTSTVQIVLSAFGLWLALILSGGFMHAPEPILLPILGGASAAVLIWQYAQRRTGIGAATLGSSIAFCFVLLHVPPLFGAKTGETRSREPEFTKPIHLTPGFPFSAGFFAIRIVGVPSGTRPQPELLDVEVDAPNGAHWESGFEPIQSSARVQWNWSSLQTETGLERWLTVNINRRFPDAFERHPVRIRASVIMTVYRTTSTATIPPDGRFRRVVGLGICSAITPGGVLPPELHCRSTEPASTEVFLNGSNIGRGWTLFDPNPFSEISARIDPSESAVLTVQRPVARIRRDLDIPDVKLGDR